MFFRGIGRHVRAAMRAMLCFASLCAVAHSADAQTVDQDLVRCPTAAEVASVTAKLTLIFDSDPTAPALVCTAGAGSANLTLLQRRAYNAVLAMQRLSFAAPLPWTSPATASLWDWFTNQAGITGIRFSYTSSGGLSYCCDPANVVNIVVGPNSYLYLTDRWDTYTSGPAGYGGGLGDTVALFAHEARHNQGKLHDCAGGSDSTFEQMGAWAVQSLFWYWVGNHGNPAYLRPVSEDVGGDYYLDDARTRAESTRAARICNDTRVLRTASDVEFYHTGLNHYFMTANVAEATGIDNGAAGPNWSRTGKMFKVFPEALHAPMNALPVCRFYGTPGRGPNSHFYTIDPAECAAVKRDPGWKFEGEVFYLLKPYFDHSCPIYGKGDAGNGSTVRILRDYNNRAAANDSSHRYATDLGVYNAMIAAGRTGEKVVMCAPE